MKKFILMLLVLVLILPMSAQAATFESGDQIRYDDPVSDDLYTAAEVVNVATDINGDFYSAAGQVILDGLVSQDSSIVAGDAVIKGEIADDLRVAAGSINLGATVKGDMLVATGSLLMDSDSFVGGDLYGVVGQVVMEGDVNGDVKLIGDHDSAFHLNSTIGGSLTVRGFEHITFGPKAKVAGDLWYRTQEAIEIPEGVVMGEVTFKQKELREKRINRNLPAVMAGFSLFSFLSKLFFGLFFIWFFRYFIIDSVGRSYEAPLKSIGIGFIVVVLVPVAFIVLLITTIGIPVALVTAVAWLVFLYFAKIMAAMLIGFKIIHIDQTSKFGRLYGSFALGAFIFTLIGMAPIFGWIVNCLFVLIALGGMTSHFIEIFQHLRKKKLF